MENLCRLTLTLFDFFHVISHKKGCSRVDFQCQRDDILQVNSYLQNYAINDKSILGSNVLLGSFGQKIAQFAWEKHFGHFSCLQCQHLKTF